MPDHFKNDALQEGASLQNEAIRQALASKRRPNSDKRVAVAFGREVDAKPLLARRFAFRSAKSFLDHPETLVRDAKPGYHYAWPNREDPEAQARIRAGFYRLVTTEEVDLEAYAAITTHKGPEDVYVVWNKHILVEIHPDAWAELFEGPAFWSATRLAQTEDEYRIGIERESKGAAEAIIESPFGG